MTNLLLSLSNNIKERKWVFVSMLSLDIFDSHRLHRDTFSDETLLSVIEASFVFWQRSSSSAQGQAFLGRYQVLVKRAIANFSSNKASN